MTKIQLKRSNVLDSGKAKEPTAEQTEYGELCVNYNVSDPSLFIKDSNNNIVKIAGDSSISSPDVGSGTITIKQPGIATDQTFNVNQGTDTTITLLNDNTEVTPGAGLLTIKTSGGDTGDNTFSANATEDATITLPAISFDDITDKPTIGNAEITLVSYSEGLSANKTFRVNQTANDTITLPQIRYEDISGTPTAGNFLSLDSDAGNQVIESTGIVTNRGSFDIGSESGVTRLTQAESRVLNISPMTEKGFIRFIDDFDVSSSVQIALGDNANSALSVTRAVINNPDSSQAYPKAILARCDLRNGDIEGGSSNALNTPATFSSSTGFNGNTKVTTYSLFNCQNVTSDDPEITNDWQELIGFNFKNQSIGWNDGRLDQSLKDTKIVGFNTNLANDGSCGGSADVWSIYSNGDAPLFNRGVVKVKNGIEFNGDQNSIGIDPNLTISQYEKGTFTPVLSGSDTNIIYTEQTGYYTLLDTTCTVIIDLTYSGAHGSGQITASLPIQPLAVASNTSGLGVASIVSASVDDDRPILARVSGAKSVSLIYGGARTKNTGGAKVKYELITSGQLRIQITYNIA